MGSVSGQGDASRTRSEENDWSNTNQATTQNTQQNANLQQQGNTRANFDSPEAQSILGYLSGQAQQGGGFQQQAGNAYGSLASLQGGVNPQVENIIKTGNEESNTNFQNKLAESRAGGYRGGTGANLYSQDQVSRQFANDQAGQNASLRYGAFNDAVARQQAGQTAGAAGLAGLSGQSQGAAAQLLALLRGQDVQQASQGQTDTDVNGNTITNQQGGKSGTQSKTSQGISASYQYA